MALSNADKEAYGQVYNVGSGVNYSVNEVAAMISDDGNIFLQDWVKQE